MNEFFTFAPAFIAFLAYVVGAMCALLHFCGHPSGDLYLDPIPGDEPWNEASVPESDIFEVAS